MRSSLRNLFDHEREIVARARRFVRRLRGRIAPRADQRPPERRGPPARLAGSEPPGPPRRRGPFLARRRRRWRLPSRTGMGGLLLSLAIHALLATWLLSFLFPPREPERALVGPITIHLSQAPPAPPAPTPETKPPPKPEPEPEPKPPARPPKERRVPRPEPDTPVSRPAGEVEPAPRVSLEPPRPSLQVVPIGVGLRPPPLDSGPGPPAVSHGSSRYQGKATALSRYGGSGATENAVARGLRWLAIHQEPGGGWSAAGFRHRCGRHSPCPGAGLPEFDIGVSGLALLAFLGAGNSPRREGPYRDVVHRAIESLLSRQDAEGSFSPRGKNYQYDHAIATFALAEAYEVDPRDPLLDAVRGALRLSRSSQQAGGGWDYAVASTGRNDLSISGWHVMAMQAARAAGISLPPAMREATTRFLGRAFRYDGTGIYADVGLEAGRGGINMVAVALLSHFYLGGGPDDPRARRALSRLLRAPPSPEQMSDWDHTFQSYYYWYAATLCLFHVGGHRWKAWNRFLQQAILPLQRREPHLDGSWDPEKSWIGQSGGRVYATAINVLTLEVYYRYEPLFATDRRP